MTVIIGGVKLEEMRTLALRHLAAGDFTRALRLHAHLLARIPDDLDSRMRVGDICVRTGQLDAARPVYAAVAYLDIQSGRPLHALVAMQALTDLGEDVTPLRQALAKLYSAGSERVAKVGARLSPPAPDTEVDAPPDKYDKHDDLAAAQSAAVAAASDMTTIKEFPTRFQPVPLLSELSESALDRVLTCAGVRRLAHGATVVKKDDPGDAFFFVAAGQVRVHRPNEQGGEQELARLYEGAIFGEMALIQAESRSASVTVVGAADLISFGRDAIRAAADELPALATALDRYTRDRLIKNAVATSPLFAPFSPSERLELLRRFVLRELGEGQLIWDSGGAIDALLLVVSGELAILGGEPPFEKVTARIQPGDCVGEVEMLRKIPAQSTIRAARRTLVLALSHEYFDRLVMTVPEVKAWMETRAKPKARTHDEPLF